MKKILSICAVALTLSGCSAIREGYFEKLTITTEPENAVCVIKNPDGAIVSTVLSGETAYNIRRSRHPFDVTCSKKGFVDTQVTVESENDPVTNGNVLATLGVDGILGTSSKYPDTLHVVLRR